MIFITFIYSDYLDNTISNRTKYTETFLNDDIFLSNTTCHYKLTTCAKLITHELRGVVCVDHTSSSMVSINFN